MTLRRREAKPSDHALVIDSWKRSYEGSPAVRGADREHYRVDMTRTIRRLLDKASIRVACDPDDEDTVVGWVAYTGTELHWGYVKEAFRSECKLSWLLEGVPITAYTFRGRMLEHALVGINGCRFEAANDNDTHVTWHPPKGWRFTPRHSI
jgi:hypothetical protein